MSGFKEEKARAAAWFGELRDQIVAAFEGLEDSNLTQTMDVTQVAASCLSCVAYEFLKRSA